MEIKGIISSVYKSDDKFKSKSGKTPDATKKDKIEISNQAKALQNTGETKNLAHIQKKIESGFYNTDKVISKVADAILKEIDK
jgi:anti-sigma28 factor (negative regulator of flagellin synthesis)